MENLPDDKSITASQVLSYLQKNNLTNQIFMEILADINKREGYLNLKRMMEDLIHSRENQLYNPATPRSDREAIMNELSIVAVTIDIIFPNILRVKFENRLPYIVNDILEELKQEKKIDSYVPFVPSSTVMGSSKKSPASANLDSKKSAQGTSKELSMPVASPKKNIVKPSKTCSTKKKKYKIQKDEVIDEPELSLTSVSSVHTSELSSFDDQISVSSEDEQCGKLKKKVSMKDIQQACKSDRITSWCAENFKNQEPEAANKNMNRATKAAENKNKKSVVTSFEESSYASGDTQDFNSPFKSQRIRKPNSKYMSESIVCPIASKQLKRKQMEDMAKMLNISEQKKSKILKSNEELEKLSGTSDNNQPIIGGDKENSENKKASQISSGVFKPFTAVTPLTSRRTAPTLLFSTQSLQK